MPMVNIFHEILLFTSNKYICIAVSLAVLQGCVGVQSFPIAARAGDTITLALGSSDQINLSNTTVTYTPVTPPGDTIEITANIRSIFKLYPDKRAGIHYNSIAGYVPQLGGHGASIDVMVLDLPSDNILPGTGVIHVSTSGTYPMFTDTPNGKDISIEILQGSGASNTFDFFIEAISESVPTITGNLKMLEVLPHLQIKPDFDAGSVTEPEKFYAAEITIHGALNEAANNASDTDLDNSLRVLSEDLSLLEVSLLGVNYQQNQKQISWRRNGGEFTIYFVSPHGNMAYYEVSASLFFIDPTYGLSSIPTADARYYDENGIEISGPTLNVFVCTNETGCYK